MLLRISLLWLSGLLFPLLLSGQPDARPPAMQPQDYQQLQQMVEQSTVFADGFTGLTLFDPERNEYLYTYRADHYFTPASNTKVLTFFLAINLLAEGAPGLFYRDLGDTLQIWGAGDPLLLHPDFRSSDRVFRWLREQNKPILFSTANYRDHRYGSGWSWDDYNYGFQVERAPLPLYGNRVEFSKKSRYAPIRAYPERFTNDLVYDPDNVRSLSREENLNHFYFNRSAVQSGGFSRELPFVYSQGLAADLLAEALQLPVIPNAAPLPRKGRYETLTYAVPDTLYRRLLQNSDNFVAEQLLLQSSAARYGIMDAELILRFARDTLLRALPQPLQWTDGSGLSRYNQFTPRSMTEVLHQLYHLLPEDKLFGLFAVGGRSGTLRHRYGGTSQPYVFAKTGTLKNVLALSGYVHTRSGRTLVFSFMHNNFPGGGSGHKSEMEKVLYWIYKNL